MAVQIGYADSYLHLHALFRRFIIGGGIVPEAGGVPPCVGNTGNGTVTRIFGTTATVTETWTLTFTSPTAFNVVGSVSGSAAAGTVGTPYTNTWIEFKVVAGTSAFVSGDTFTIVMTRNPLIIAGDQWKIESEAGVEIQDAQLLLQAPGVTGLDTTPLNYFGVDPILTSFVPGFRIISCTAYSAGNTFYTQVGYSGANSPCLTVWEFKMKYWFIASRNRFIIIVRVYDKYFVASAGILSAYATVAQWGQCHYVAGNIYTPTNWNSYNGTMGNFPGGSSAGVGNSNSFMRILRPDNIWAPVNNFFTGGNLSWSIETTADCIAVWPWSERVNSPTAGAPQAALVGPIWKWMVEGPEVAGGTFPLLPVQYYRREGASQAIYGTVEGVYATTGGWLANVKNVGDVTGVTNPIQLANEDIITAGSDQYLAVPLCHQGRLRGLWAAFKLS